MRIPDCAEGAVEWAYPGDAEVPCLRRLGADLMLCGLPLDSSQRNGWVPQLLQPADPARVCPHCVVALASLIGRCPVCGVQLVGDEQGRAPAHRGCVGVNMALRGGA